MSRDEGRGYAPVEAAPEAFAWESIDAEVIRLGEALNERTAAVLEEIARRTIESGRLLGAGVEEKFARVGTVSTVAVARWMGGEGVEVAREVGEESWRIFGQLAEQRAAPLNEVTKRCLRWRDATAKVLEETAAELELSPEALGRALVMVQRSLDVTLVRMCETFEGERQRSHEELTRRQAELGFMATHDALTGLPNRTLIQDRLEQMLARARASREPVAALFIDLDNFKSINDTLGHRVGDEVLCGVAARLGAAVRETDALGRLAGDEFVVLADGLSVAAGPELIAECLLEALREPIALGDGEQAEVTVNASIGIAVADHGSADDLLRRADIAMYRAKREGKGRYVLFASEMQSAVQIRVATEMELQGALEREELFLVYQPTFLLKTLAPSGAEALLRWRSRTRGVVAPDEFVPLLEESGKIVDVGAWVLEEACRQARAWHDAGHPLTVAVNVSARQLDTDELIGHVKRALAKSRLDPAALTIEITETTLMRNAEDTVRRLNEIRALGPRIAIDDFGTGYSSLAYLRRFPVDALKIDRSFTSQLGEGSEGQVLLRTLVQLAKSLAIETLVEGIERPQELTVIREQQCDAGQGFLFAEPLDGAEVTRFFSEWSPERRPELAL